MLDSMLHVIQCDYGYLTDVGEEPAVALFASRRSSTNLFATLCTRTWLLLSHLGSGNWATLD